MSYDVEAVGYEETINFGNRLTSNMKDRTGTYLQEAADKVVNVARNNLQNNTNISRGDLLSDIRVLEISKDGSEVTVGTTLFYSVYIEYGRGPVRPLKPGGVLHWVDKDTGEDVFAKFARETEPSPFMEPAVIEVMSDYPEIVIKNESDFVKELI